MKTSIKTGLAALLLLLTISCKKENSIVRSSDITSENVTQDFSTDNLVLAGHTVKIGKQVWLTKNVDVSHYKNGDKIPEVQDAATWAVLTTGAWCWYNNDSATNAVYGKLYNWYAVHDPRGLGPTGWHVPSDPELTKLSTNLGGYMVAGGKMKSTGTIEASTGLWHAPNTDATNSSGFTGLPGGYRNYDGTFYNVGSYGYWWSSTQNFANSAWFRYMGFNSGLEYRLNYIQLDGFSVRCLKD